MACAEIRRDLISQIGEFALLVPWSEIIKQITTGLGQPSVTPDAPTKHNCPAANNHTASDACACAPEVFSDGNFFYSIAQDLIQG